MITLDVRNLNYDSLIKFNRLGELSLRGWRFVESTPKYIVIAHPFKGVENLNRKAGGPIIITETGPLRPGNPGYPRDVMAGTSNLPHIYELANGQTIFIFRPTKAANKVLISGDFNNWSTSGAPMTKTDSGWIFTQNLTAGMHLYKFIVDGKWQWDRNNTLKEDDGYSSYNSVYYRHNYVFQLKGHPHAQKVVLTGSFNNWNEKQLNMKLENGIWKRGVYLRDGGYAYKYIVDGSWITDPGNKIVKGDGNGNINSFLTLGQTTYFILKGYETAHNVVVTGSFNDWNNSELSMIKTDTGWVLPYLLRAGEHQYKFLVDGKYISDPANDNTEVTNPYKNSIRFVQPNYQFKMCAYPGARSVYVTGNFVNWSEPGFKMTKDVSGCWVFDIYLKPGKQLYKFVVDGHWILDPGNKDWEENEHGTGNSVLWFKK